MEMSIFDFIKNASDETLMEMAKLTQTEQQEREVKKEAKKRYYTFSGTWAWGCWATSEKDARQQFEFDAYPEMMDIDYDHMKVEVDD